MIPTDPNKRKNKEREKRERKERGKPALLG
jgi:hypothetical protein